jgi:hypothetical protein
MIVDLLSLDADVARAQATLADALRRLPDADPTERIRSVASQGTYKELLAFETTDTLLKDALARWVHELIQARVAWPLLVDEHEAMEAVDPTVARAAPEAMIPKRYREGLAALVSAPDVMAIDRALARLDAMALPVAAVRAELRARRFEAARRLGLEHPWASAPELAALARSLLDATQPLATDVRRGLRKKSEIDSPALVIDDAFGREAVEGWPANLHARWLEDVFRAIAPRPPKRVVLPAAISGASFLRGAAAWGRALRLTSVARSLPFALAHDPQPADAHAFGAALACAVASRTFAKKQMGVPERAADRHERVLCRVLLHGLRSAAVTVLTGIRAGDAEPLSADLYGVPLPSGLASAWSYGQFGGASRIDAPARLVGALRGAALARTLRDRFDEDWFANPRAGVFLASIGAGPVWSSEAAPDVAPIAREFEERLG